MKPWRAYKSLEWFIFTGFALAGFFALVAVATLMATTRPVVRWQVSQTTPSDVLHITDADLICNSHADCAVVFLDCGYCGEEIGVNVSAAARIREEMAQQCVGWHGTTCVREMAAATCRNHSCGFGPPTPISAGLPHAAGWPTYRNDQHGYSLRYPSNWTSVIYSDTNTLFGPAGETFADRNGESKYTVLVDAAVMDNPQTIESIAQRGRNDGKTVRFLTVAGLPAVQHEDHTYTHTFVIRGDVLYMIVYNASTNAKITYDAMIQSFQITNNVDTTGWKTFGSEQYGFEFSYPPGLIVVDINEYRNGAYDLLVSHRLGEELTFCDAEPNTRCERIDVDGAVGIITWPTDEYDQVASVEVRHSKPVRLELNLGPGKTRDVFRRILATLQFIP